MEGLPARLLPYQGPQDDPGLGSAEWASAVAALLRNRAAHPTGPKEWELLLIRRARHPGDPWSGHMALPGGRKDPEDPSLLHTAVREVQEELGLDLVSGGSLLGRLDVVAPRNPELPRLMVVPFVFVIEPHLQPHPSRAEVADALWAPLRALQDPRTRGVFRYVRRRGSVDFPAFRWRGQTVWGLTHRIVEDLLGRMG